MASNPPEIDPRDQNFLREVDEEYRAEQMKAFARKYGRWILLVAGIALVAAAVALFWRADQEKKLYNLSERYGAALEQVESGDRETAAGVFDEIAASSNDTYRTLARLSAAGVALDETKRDKAVADLEAVLADEKAPTALQQAAGLHLLRLQFDELPVADLLEKTRPYLDGDNPWFPIAGELAGLAYLKDGKTKEAGELFHRIAKDDRVTQSLRARAEQLAAAAGHDVSDLYDDVSADAPSAGAAETAAETKDEE